MIGSQKAKCIYLQSYREAAAIWQQGTKPFKSSFSVTFTAKNNKRGKTFPLYSLATFLAPQSLLLPPLIPET